MSAFAPSCRLDVKVDLSPPGDRLQKDHKAPPTCRDQHNSGGRNHLKDMSSGLIRVRLNKMDR